MFYDREGRPKIANVFVALLITLLLIVLYALLTPFTFVFKTDGEVVYTQEEVKPGWNFAEKAVGTEGSDVVYSEDAVEFTYTNAFGKTVVYDDSYGGLRIKMILLAAKNLFTFNWDEENYVVEFNS